MTLHIKFLAKIAPDQNHNLWLSLFHGREPIIDNCQFHFDLDFQDYDWLVVYEGLPPLTGQKKINRLEKLSCLQENTLLITTEPSSIRIDGPHFLKQFGHVLTAKNPKFVKHPNQIFQTPPLRWFYGRPFAKSDNNYTDLDTFFSQNEIQKKHDISTVCSNKRMQHTMHAQRYDCIMELKKRMGDELSLFGRGINPISNKSEAMDDYRYHIAIENHIEPHHWTEKISDCFLAFCLPFYYGPPNINQYFPEEAIIPIDIFDIDGTEAIIKSTIASDQYTKRLPAIKAARKRVLTDYNLMNIVANIVADKHQTNGTLGQEIKGRHVFRKSHLIKASLDAIHRIRFNSG